MTQHIGQGVTVRVEGNTDRRVAEKFGDDLGVDACAWEWRSCGTVEIVKPYLCHTGSSQAIATAHNLYPQTLDVLF
jgi:hypothetical protein